MSAKKTAFYGMFLALALVAGYNDRIKQLYISLNFVKLVKANIDRKLIILLLWLSRD